MSPPSPNPSSVPIPASKISGPKHVQWHMVLDNELDMLTDKQAGVMGAIGFTALGGVVGGLIPCVAAIEKINVSPLTPIDVVALAVFFASLTASLICLITFFCYRHQNTSLKEEIRKRGKGEDTFGSRSPFTGRVFTIPSISVTQE